MSGSSDFVWTAPTYSEPECHPLFFETPPTTGSSYGGRGRWSTVTATHAVQCKSHFCTWQIIVSSVTSHIQIMLQQECICSSALNVVFTGCLMTKNKRKLAWHCNQAMNSNKVPIFPLQYQCKDLGCKLILPEPNQEIPCHDMAEKWCYLIHQQIRNNVPYCYQDGSSNGKWRR